MTDHPMHDDDHDELHDHDRGLAFDLPRLLTRRNALKVLAGAGAGVGFVALTGCGTSSSSSAATSTAPSTSAPSLGSTSTTAAGSGAACTTIPEETPGPYPGDGTNGPDVLTQAGVVRSDITTSFGSMSGTATGEPLTMRLRLVDVAKGCTPMAGAAIYLWHCTQAGGYSLYSAGVTNQNYLRGVQEADADGWVTFRTIFPGCYDGRWPHMHFEIYPTLASATSVKNRLATSQLALPKDVCESVYATSGYASSTANLARTSLTRDMVFRDGYATQVPTMSGSVGSNLAGSLQIGVRGASNSASSL